MLWKRLWKLQLAGGGGREQCGNGIQILANWDLFSIDISIVEVHQIERSGQEGEGLGKGQRSVFQNKKNTWANRKGKIQTDSEMTGKTNMIEG